MQREQLLKESKGEAMKLQLEDFGFVGLLRVLETVTKYGPLNITHLSRKTELNHGSCDTHVKKLIKLGLLTEKRYDAIRMIKPVFDSFTICLKRGSNPKMIRT